MESQRHFPNLPRRGATSSVPFLRGTSFVKPRAGVTFMDMKIERHLGAVILLVLAATTAPAAPPPASLLAAPVLIGYDGRLMASGFMMITQTNQFLVTARHVFLKGNSELVTTNVDILAYGLGGPQDRQSLGLNLEVARSAGSVRTHPSKDVMVVRLFAYGRTDGRSVGSPGVKVVDGANVKCFGFNPSMGRRIKDVPIGVDALILGYPQDLLTAGLLKDQPLLRKAFIAGKNHTDRTIIVDGGVYGGNSGGPVVLIEEGPGEVSYLLAGIVTQATAGFLTPMQNPQRVIMTNSGYSIIEPYDSIAETLELFN